MVLNLTGESHGQDPSIALTMPLVGSLGRCNAGMAVMGYCNAATPEILGQVMKWPELMSQLKTRSCADDVRTTKRPE